MNKIAIVIHGGAGPDSEHIRNNKKAYEEGLQAAVEAGYAVLEKGGHAEDAVESAIKSLEDNALFNAGRGSSLNEKAEVEMCASFMSGYDLTSGAAAIVRNVRNPISLARAIAEKSKHVYIGSIGATEFARANGLPMEPDAYFITENAYDEYVKSREQQNPNAQQVGMEQALKKHGTVGCVALDIKGNLCAGTSTGGLDFSKPGRIADSSMIGVGTYANNATCAVSTTGEGEFHIQHVTAFHISALMEYGGKSLEEAARYLIKEKCKHVTADMGIIGVDREGNMVAEFNTQRMHRAMKATGKRLVVKVYPD